MIAAKTRTTNTTSATAGDTVTLHAPAAEIRRRIGAHWGSVEEVDADRCDYRPADDNLHWLAIRVLMLGVDFDAHEPPELIEHLRVLRRRIDRAAER